MKLRQKLAVVLASAMIVSAVPVVTMAASSNSVTKVVTVADDETPLGASAPKLKIELKDGFTTSSNFYLELEEAEWAKDSNDKYIPTTVYATDGTTELGTVTPTSDTEATVSLPKGDDRTDKFIYVSFENVKVTGEAKVKIDGDNTEVSSTSSGILFAKKSDSNAVVTAKDLVTFYTTGSTGEEVGTLVITEDVAGSFAGKAEEDRTITVDLDNGDYEFVSSADVKIKGSKGFSSHEEASIAAKDITFSPNKETITIVLPAWSSNTKGAFEITGIKVKSTEKNPQEGDLTFTVEGKDDTKVESTSVKVATVSECGTELTVDNKDTVKAGKTTKVKLTYKELSENAVPEGDVDFVLSQGYLTKSFVKNIGGTPIYEDSKDEQDDEIIGFTISFGGDKNKKEEWKNKEIEIVTHLDMSGEVKITTSGRYVEEQSVVVAEIKPVLSIKAEPIILKVGQAKQVGGKLEITEAETGSLNKHSVITLELTDEDGISFTEVPEVTVSGGGKATKVDWVDGTSKTQIKIDLTKGTGTEPATITVEGFEVKVDRTVPEGSFDLKVKVDGYGTEKLKVKDFFVVGTPNTQDLAANGLAKGTAKFTINSAEYTVNDKVATMDAAAYIQDPGYTMIPVRYVAEAFGVLQQDILFSNGTVTLFAGSRTIQLTAGSNIAVVNGAPVSMSTKVVIKDGRTYAPVGEIARILGITASWDSSAKVATFENK